MRPGCYERDGGLSGFGREMGAESDFTNAIKPIEKAAGIVVGGKSGSHAAK